MKSLIKKFFDKSLGRFIIVGIINTLFGTAIMFGFYNILHMNYWVSSAANYFFGSILSYFLNKYFTFQSKERSVKSVLRFIINISLCYLVAYGLAKPLIHMVLSSVPVKIQENIAMLAGMSIFVVLNYCGQRFFVFIKK